MIAHCSSVFFSRDWYTHDFPFVSFSSSAHHRDLHSFPTRRSSDLEPRSGFPSKLSSVCLLLYARRNLSSREPLAPPRREIDRKSTRLNSSHEWISYAVFCLKKKKKIK